MNEEFEDLLGPQEMKPKKEVDTEFVKALEQRKVGIYPKRNNVPSYDLQVSAEDIFIKKEFKEMRCEMPGTPRSTFLMVFSPDGTKVASTHGNHNIHVTDIRSGKNIRTLVGHPRTPWCIAFHPTSNQILASGCLGGQVRIWDLSGGSEVWTAVTQTVIASIAFHPDDRLLVIATYNELYFWDWSKPEPFMHVATNSIKEKVRYVAFDKLGHKLITGIANSPQTRWERVRAPVPVPRQVDRAASPYRRRITPRLISNNPISPPIQLPQRTANREPLSTVPERERRITACYRNLVREYELLVHRYLQLYRPPTMIDQGTDPMEVDLNTLANSDQNPGPSTSGLQNSQTVISPSTSRTLWSPAPSTSGIQNQNAASATRRLGFQKTISSTGMQTGSSDALRKKPRNSAHNTNENHNSHPDSPSTSIPVDLSRCSTCETVHTSSGINTYYRATPSNPPAIPYLTTAAGNFQRLNSTFSFNPRDSISATRAFESRPTIPREVVMLTPSDICTLRRSIRSYRSTQTQNTEQSTESIQTEPNLDASVPSTSGIQNRNERRNSAPASTVNDVENIDGHVLRKGESEEKLAQNSTNASVRQYVNVSKTGSENKSKLVVVKSPPTFNNADNSNSNQNSTSNPSKLVVIRPSSSNVASTSATQAQSSRRLLIISTSLGTQTVNDNQHLQENSDDSNFKMRIRCSPNSKNTNGVNKTDEVKGTVQNEETLPNANQEPSTSETAESAPKSNLSNILQNAEKLFSKCFVSHNLAKRGSNTVPNANTETPSIPNVVPRTMAGASNSTVEPGSGRMTDVSESPKFFEQARKRVYPGFSKKTARRPILDSSSNTSSSDEDDHSKRHIPCSNFLINSYVDLKPTSSANVQSTASNNTTVNELETAPQTVPSSLTETSSASVPARRPLNFNAELEMLVTDLLANSDNTTNSDSVPSNPSGNNHNTASNLTGLDKTCGTCGGTVQDRNRSSSMTNLDNTTNPNHCARTAGGECPRSLIPNSSTYARPASPRRRFFSAFYPTRMQNLRSYSRLRRNSSFLSPLMRSTLRSLNTLQGPNRLPGTFAPDEVINYSERANSEEEVPEPPAEFHPFDPPPEFATINPENIGIGNMYSNIVQELESSLNDVRNIRVTNRLGETSDMLSSFSERLESIMNQSNSILRNLRSSIDTLTPPATNYETRPQPISPRTSSEPQLLFNDRSFYLREQGNTSTNETNFETTDANELIEDSANHEELFSNHNAVAADHTYPLNSRNPQASSNIMTPLMVSLHLTVSHIQRQARLLRQQVESIERIDRAMLEVAQLQLLRQLFAEMQRYIRANPSMENRSTVSSVRQMMAGTRISDSSPYDSPNEEVSTENQNVSTEAVPSTSGSLNQNENQSNSTTQNRNQNRKTYPRCIFLMHRNLRRGTVGNTVQRRYLPRERIMRRHFYRRAFTCRSLIPRTPIDLTTNRNQPSSNLHSITRRLEQFLMDHARNIGRATVSVGTGGVPTERDEYILMLRLNHCRARVNAQLGYSEYFSPTIRRQGNSVSADGAPRYGARDLLTSAADSLSRFIEHGIPSTPSLRLVVWDVIDLSVLLSEILLLQIVDSIPPPTGMNLDPERESLSARIDQMCSRILQSRLSGHSHQLTRSLRLTRIAVRHASRALDQTYTARRNAMLPSGNERDQRRELLAEINNCLRNIRRNHMAPPQLASTESTPENLSMREWFRTIHGHISRYATSPPFNEDQPSTSNSAVNAETGEQVVRPRASSISYEQVNSDDDTEPEWYNNNVSRERARPLYRTNNVNLLHSEESNNRSRPWNVPTVQVNDIPISQYQSQWHPRFAANRQRISERITERVSELRTYTIGGLYRPRFLHPLYAGVNPFDADLDESTREQIYESDIIAAVSPHHRIQVWEFSSGIIPNINNALKNIVVNECRIHNDASVAIATDGSILVALLPSGSYINIANRLGVYSLEWESLGQCLYVATFEQNAVSVSLSPLSRHLVVGLTSRRVSIIPSDKWTMARIFMLDEKQPPCTQLSSIRDVEQNRDPNYMSLNCIRWLPLSGQGLIYGTNTGQLRVLT